MKIGSGPTGASVQQDIASGSSVQIQAIAESGAQFQKWSDDNTNATRTVTVNAAMSLQAIFVAEEPEEDPEPGTTCKVKLSSSDANAGLVKIDDGEPAVEVEKDVAVGSTVQISAIPHGEGVFNRWSDGDENLVRTITVNTDIELEAYINILNEDGGVNF